MNTSKSKEKLNITYIQVKILKHTDVLGDDITFSLALSRDC